jgi:SNF2 family DNA or RNA helicase
MTATTPTRGHLAKIRDDLEFYPHQIEGVRELDRRTSFILADEMGLGKSIQALTVAAVAFERGETNRILVICPASLKGNWADEIKAHTLFSTTVLAGSRKQRDKQLETLATDILIVNYEQVESHLARLNSMGFGIAIYDEAHYIKGRKSARTRACQGLRMPRHFLLTGSPLLNQVDDLWTLLNRIDPAEFPTYWRFINRYAVYGGYQDRQIVGIKNELELREKLQTRMLRREKKDVLDLPDKQHIVIRLDMSPLQRKLYEQMRDELRVDAPSLEDGELTSPNAMTKMLRLKQICGTCSIVPGQPDDSAKLDRAVEMVREMIDSNEPVVIFTQFREVLARMVDRLVKAGLSPRQLHGDIPVDGRMPIVRDWTDDNNAGNAQPIVCMFQVAGVGLNMTSAARLIFLDKLYVPKLNEQAEDRLHRIGADKTQPIQIFHLHMRNTIDSRIEAILKRKSDIFDTVVTTDNSEWKKKLIAAVLADEDDEPDDS